MGKSLLSDVLANVKLPNRCVSWFDRLTPELQAEAEDIRAQFAAGSLGNVDATSLARALLKSLETRGATMPHYKQVQRWLREKR